jgi:hypothetical protein
MKRSLWISSFLAVTVTAVGMECWAAWDRSSNTVPWTDLIADNIPKGITLAAIGILIAWLPSHFTSRYDRGSAVANPLDPNVDHPTEPLFNRAIVTTVVTLILDAVVAFGVPISNDQRAAVIAVISVVAPLALAAWARRHVYSPAKVVALVEAAKASVPQPVATQDPPRPTLLRAPSTPPPTFPPKSA